MENNITVTNAQYYINLIGETTSVTCEINNVQMSVPLDPANRHYAEILKHVEAGTLTVADAD